MTELQNTDLSHMKKLLILAALLGGISFASTAAPAVAATTAATVATTAVPTVDNIYVINPNKLLLQDYTYHFTHCGVDTWAWGSTEDEMWEVVGVLIDAYC